MKISEAQKIVREFARSKDSLDEPSIDKFDHAHEELVEMSRLLRYKTREEKKDIVREKRDIFEDGIGDLLFVTLRLANQLGIDAEKAFERSSKSITGRYGGVKEND